MKIKTTILSVILILSIVSSPLSALCVVAEDEVVLPLDGYEASGLYTEAQYDYVKAKVAAKEEPWFSAYEKLISFADEWIDEEPSAVESWYVPGYYTNANGHKEAREILMNDAKSAYACAVAYKFTGKKKYAEQTIKILDAWTILTSVGNEDSKLVFTYVGDSLIMSADLVKGYPYWTNKAAFDTWVKDYYLILANKSWSSGNSGDWNLLARSLGYAYLGDMESLKNTIVGDEEQNMSLKFLIGQIMENGVLYKELERGSNGLWYSYFALAPMTACCQVLYNNLGEDYFNWESSAGRSVRQAVETYFYYINHPDEWNQMYNEYFGKTSYASPPMPPTSTSWPLPLFEAMAGIYNNQDFCDYVGRYRPVYGSINDGVFHHFAWFFPTLMYGTLQLGGGLPEYSLPAGAEVTAQATGYTKTEYYQDFEGTYEVVHSTTPNGRDKYALKDGDSEIYYIERSSGTYDSSPISLIDDGSYGGKSVTAPMAFNARVVLNLPRSYTADDGIVSLEMRWYRPSDVAYLDFYGKPIEEAYNIPEDNIQAAYMYHVKYERFFFDSTKVNAAKLPSGSDYYAYKDGGWIWFKFDFDFDNEQVTIYYKDARNDSKWIPWGIDNNVFPISGNSLGSLLFDWKGDARIDDIKITTHPVYLKNDSGVVRAIVKNSEVNLPYEWQLSKTADFAQYTTAASGVYTGEELSYIPENDGEYIRLVLEGKATYPIKLNSVYAEAAELYRSDGSDTTDLAVKILSEVPGQMYAASTVTNTSNDDKTVLIAVAVYDKNNTLVSVKLNTALVPANSYYTISTEKFSKQHVGDIRIFVMDPETLTEYTSAKIIPKW